MLCALKNYDDLAREQVRVLAAACSETAVDRQRSSKTFGSSGLQLLKKYVIIYPAKYTHAHTRRAAKHNTELYNLWCHLSKTLKWEFGTHASKSSIIVSNYTYAGIKKNP